MDMKNLISQMSNASNPLSMIMSMLNPNQQQLLNSFKGKSKQEQAEHIAKVCNEKGINKEQLQTIINNFGLK